MLDLIDQIRSSEAQAQTEPAQRLREALLDRMGRTTDADLLVGADFLCHEDRAIPNGEAGFLEAEPVYIKLHDLLCSRLGDAHQLTALAKRKLAKFAFVLGRKAEAESLIRKAIEALKTTVGKDSEDCVEAVNTLREWIKYVDQSATDAVELMVRQDYPICDHLEPIEALMTKSQAKVDRHVCSGGSVRLMVQGWFDIAAIQTATNLPACVEDFRYYDPKSGSGAGFTCRVHKHVIEGRFDKSETLPTIGTSTSSPA